MEESVQDLKVLIRDAVREVLNGQKLNAGARNLLSV